MDARLNSCMGYLEGFDVLYDIGSDHALLPIHAVKKGLIKKAYAVDNKEGPLKQAADNIAAFGLEDKVIPLLSDGMQDLPGTVGAVSITGLGGKTIHDILRDADFKNVRRFILQPNNEAHRVRDLTKHRGLKIVDETVVAQKDALYQIIVFEPGSQSLSEKDRYIGPVLRAKKPAAYHAQLKKEHRFLAALLEKIPDESAQAPVRKKMTLLEEVFDEWRED